MHRHATTRGALAAALILAVAGCGGPRDRFRGLPRDQVRFIFGPWLNGMLLPPEERYHPHLALVELLETGEVTVRLPRRAHGQAWCHVAVPGYEPILLWGDVDEVGAHLREGRLRFRKMRRPDCGIVTGVTYHGSVRGVRDFDRACRATEPSTTLAFVDDVGHKTSTGVDDRGVYRAVLPPGLYRVAASWLRSEGIGPSPAFDDVLVEAGSTTVLDIRLTPRGPR